MNQDDPDSRSGRRLVAYAVPDARQSYFTFGFICVAGLVFFGCLATLALAVPNILDTAYFPVVAIVMLVVLVVVCVLALRRLYAKKVGVVVTADGLTVDGRPGGVFPLRDAQLGQWTGRRQQYGPESMGRAVFLTSGSDRFVVGAADRQVAGSVPSHGPQERYAGLDASMSPQAFDELLAVIGPQRQIAREPELSPTPPTQPSAVPGTASPQSARGGALIVVAVATLLAFVGLGNVVWGFVVPAMSSTANEAGPNYVRLVVGVVALAAGVYLYWAARRKINTGSWPWSGRRP